MDARFEILDIPGSGAHATVCIARDHEAGAIRALKVLREGFDPESSEARRVRDEGRILERVQHRALPRVYAQLEIAGRQVLVMDFVDGPSVAWLIRRLGALPVDVALQIVRDVAEAVHHVYTASGDGGHPARLVHRDLNLSNVLLDRRKGVRVLDFGMARAEFVDREAHTLVSLRGTPGYTAPEGLRAIADNPGLDVYSLGIGLLVMCSGHLPVLSRKENLHAEGLVALAKHVVETTGRADAAELATAMCAFHPGDRPTMGDVVDRIPDRPEVLEAFLAREVADVLATRQAVDPLIHQSYPELAFLEGVHMGANSDNASARADELVRRFLRRPAWMERTQDLKWLLARYPEWTSAPFVEALAPLERPWWKIGPPALHPRGAVVCLCALSHRPGAGLETGLARARRVRHPAVAEVMGVIATGQVVPIERAEQFDWSK
jgi:serine/threonine-protein kinase